MDTFPDQAEVVSGIIEFHRFFDPEVTVVDTLTPPARLPLVEVESITPTPEETQTA